MMRMLSVAALAALVALPSIAAARNPHFVGSPTCVVEGDQLCCSGKVAGLGTAPTTVAVNTTFNCRNRGGHEPPGQASGESEPIDPRGGQITFTDVCTSVASCPDDMTPTFGPGATINIFQNGNLVFSATVPIN